MGLEEITSGTVTGRDAMSLEDKGRMSDGIKQWMMHNPKGEEVTNTEENILTNTTETREHTSK